MRYLIDTNIIIFALKNKAGKCALRLQRVPVAEQRICSIVEAELLHGATKYDLPSKRETVLAGFLAPYQSLPFDSDCARHYARIRDLLERQGNLIGHNDLMIAAIALAHDLTLVTHNGDEFKRVPDLRVEDWTV